MREILFRGKRVDNGEWVYGYPYENYRNSYLRKLIALPPNEFGRGEYIEVIPETVGQYTGLTANGKKIFEGDVVNVNTNKDSLHHSYRGRHLIIKFDEYHRFVASGRLEYPLCNHYEWEIIGNIHDNPELLKGGEG
jgi:uncharacterized phage protein (TIGR01671 family)